MCVWFVEVVVFVGSPYDLNLFTEVVELIPSSMFFSNNQRIILCKICLFVSECKMGS